MARRPSYPLKDPEAFYVPVTSRLYHDGSRPEDREHVRLIRRGLGLAEDGAYDEEVADAVRKVQRQKKLPVTGVVDRRTWSKVVPAS